YLYAVAWRDLAQDLQHQFRLEAYEHVQRLDMAFFEDRNTGGLMAVLNDDVNQLERFLDGGANEILQLATTVVVVGGVFLGTIPQVAWMTFLPIPFIYFGSVRFQKAIGPRYTEVRQQVGFLNGLLSNNLTGIATIKSYVAESHESQRVRQASQAYAAANQSAIRLSAAFVPIIRMLIVAGFVAILVAGGELVARGGLNVGVYSVMIFLTQRLLWPITRLGATLDLYQRSLASTARLLDLLETKATIVPGNTDLQKVEGQLQLHQVTFAYAGREPVLHGLDLDIPAGKTTAVVGLTGSGKSTIVKLLLRFYEPQSGSITLDGHELGSRSFETLRRSIGLVSQDVFLLDATVAENIAYGTFGASR
ncbi:MAG: ATP-binding cassette domain-containing protein, partial [Candidatus Eremiobacteraeota bacterium]|nr:ATP-binding cassette domain-containing protein [Candidatus Eremiobacteraeota bacterium]